MNFSQSVLLLNFVEIVGFVKIVRLISLICSWNCQNYFMDFSVIWICQICYMDLSELLRKFFKVSSPFAKENQA